MYELKDPSKMIVEEFDNLRAFLTRYTEDFSKFLAEKNAAYGNSVVNSQTILKQLYPNGIQTEQYIDALYVVRILDKLSRIASNKDAFGEDPWKDICGYSLLRIVEEHKHE